MYYLIGIGHLTFTDRKISLSETGHWLDGCHCNISFVWD